MREFKILPLRFFSLCYQKPGIALSFGLLISLLIIGGYQEVNAKYLETSNFKITYPNTWYSVTSNNGWEAEFKPYDNPDVSMAYITRPMDFNNKNIEFLRDEVTNNYWDGKSWKILTNNQNQYSFFFTFFGNGMNMGAQYLLQGFPNKIFNSLFEYPLKDNGKYSSDVRSFNVQVKNSLPQTLASTTDPADEMSDLFDEQLKEMDRMKHCTLMGMIADMGDGSGLVCDPP